MANIGKATRDDRYSTSESVKRWHHRSRRIRRTSDQEMGEQERVGSLLEAFKLKVTKKQTPGTAEATAATKGQSA